MKKFFHLFAAILAVFLLGFGVASCSDDDDSENGGNGGGYAFQGKTYSDDEEYFIMTFAATGNSGTAIEEGEEGAFTYTVSGTTVTIRFQSGGEFEFVYDSSGDCFWYNEEKLSRK